MAASQDDFGMILALHVHIKDADNLDTFRDFKRQISRSVCMRSVKASSQISYSSCCPWTLLCKTSVAIMRLKT